MGQQVFDIDAVGFSNELGNYFDFYVNNTFYLLAPDYYSQFYSVYLNRCLSAFDGWVNGWHNSKSGLVPQRMLQSIARGLTNMVFCHGIDFNGGDNDYQFIKKWSKDTKFYKALKKAFYFSVAGGTSLMMLNRENNTLYVTSHRIDTYFANTDSQGKVVSVRVFFDLITNTNPTGEAHFGVCEERYFNEDGQPVVKCSVYRDSGNLQTNVQARPSAGNAQRVKWDSLPRNVKNVIKDKYPSMLLDTEQYLPFKDNLGCFLIKFTDCIPQIPNAPFGQPIGDILWTENFQYDQMKYFEKNEVDLAKARALIPEPMWNKDDPMQENRALDERFYQKVSSVDGDSDKVTPIQFNLRGNDMKTVMENIYKDIAFKLQVSASSVATFLNEGAGARTATEIVNERTKTDTWIDSQINLNKPEVDELLSVVMLYYARTPVEIVFKAENQSPELETLKTWGDQLTAGNISVELFVRKVHKNLSLEEQAREIENLKQQKELRDSQVLAMNNAYNGNN